MADARRNYPLPRRLLHADVSEAFGDAYTALGRNWSARPALTTVLDCYRRVGDTLTAQKT